MQWVECCCVRSKWIFVIATILLFCALWYWRFVTFWLVMSRIHLLKQTKFSAKITRMENEKKYWKLVTISQNHYIILIWQFYSIVTIVTIVIIMMEWDMRQGYEKHTFVSSLKQQKKKNIIHRWKRITSGQWHCNETATCRLEH